MFDKLERHNKKIIRYVIKRNVSLIVSKINNFFYKEEKETVYSYPNYFPATKK